MYGMKYNRKGHKDRNRHKNRIERSGQARLVYVKTQTVTSHHEKVNPRGRERMSDQSKSMATPLCACIYTRLSLRLWSWAHLWPLNAFLDSTYMLIWSPDWLKPGNCQHWRHGHFLRSDADLRFSLSDNKTNVHVGSRNAFKFQWS